LYLSAPIQAYRQRFGDSASKRRLCGNCAVEGFVQIGAFSLEFGGLINQIKLFVHKRRLNTNQFALPVVLFRVLIDVLPESLDFLTAAPEFVEMAKDYAAFVNRQRFGTIKDFLTVRRTSREYHSKHDYQEQPQPSVLEDEPQQEQQTQNFVPVGIKTLPAPMPSVQDEKPAQTQVENQSSETKTASKDVRSNEQIEKIRAKYLEYKPRTVKDIYVDKPNTVKPYSPGSLTPEFLQNGLNMLKFMRFLAGLSEDVVYTPELNDLAQHGAVILAANGKITHTPSQPSDMDETFYKRAYKSTKTATLYWSSAKQATLEAAVRGFFDDSDRSNIDRLGHRRWMLKPSLKNVGFGCAVSSAGTFIPIQVFDISGKEKTDMPYVQYPAPGYFPAAFFRPTQAWSVNLSPKVYDLIRCKPNVKLTCLDDGRQWDFSLSDTDKDGKYFNVDESVFGRQYCIIFRPDSLGSLDVNRRFKVEISGVVDKVGKLLTIEYEVEFFQDDVFGK